MNIIFITEFYPTSEQADVRGGVEMRTWQLSQRAAQQHIVSVIAVSEPTIPQQYQLQGVTVQRVGPTASFRQGGGYLARLRYVLAARRIVMNHSADLIMAENFLGYVVAWLLPSAKRAQCVLTYHDVWVGQWIKNVGLIFGVVGEFVERLVLWRNWSAYIANSQATAAKLLAHGVPEQKVSVIYNGIEYGRYQVIVPEKFLQPTVVCVARLVGYKKIDDLLKAFQLIQKEISCRLVIIGSGPDQKHLHALSDRLSLSSVVEWRGFVPCHDDVLAAIKGATVFCLPSAIEGMGIVTLEAMACGVPYVSSDIPPTREVTANSQGGLLYPVGDYQALAAKLVELMTDEKRRQVLIEQGRQQAKKFDWSVIGEQFDQQLKQIKSDIERKAYS